VRDCTGIGSGVRGVQLITRMPSWSAVSFPGPGSRPYVGNQRRLSLSLVSFSGGVRQQSKPRGPDKAAGIVLKDSQPRAGTQEAGEASLGLADRLRICAGSDLLDVESDAAHASTVDHALEVEHGHGLEKHGACHDVCTRPRSAKPLRLGR
jgi:hypothetical protein